MGIKPQFKQESYVKDRVVDLASKGVSKRAIWQDCLSTWPDKVPSSYRALYKYYEGAFNSGKLEVDAKVGSKLIEGALEGDFKAQKFYLETRGGWGLTEPAENEDRAEAEDARKSEILKKFGKMFTKED